MKKQIVLLSTIKGIKDIFTRSVRAISSNHKVNITITQYHSNDDIPAATQLKNCDILVCEPGLFSRHKLLPIVLMKGSPIKWIHCTWAGVNKMTDEWRSRKCMCVYVCIDCIHFITHMLTCLYYTILSRTLLNHTYIHTKSLRIT